VSHEASSARRRPTSEASRREGDAEERRPLHLFCDGAGAERTGKPGGWAWLAIEDEVVVAHGSGRLAKTSSLVMELTAVLSALEAAQAHGWHETHALVVCSDSTIALDVAKGTFVPKPPQYRALCQRVRDAFLASGATAKWVRGHAGQKWNEAVDALAATARDAKG